MLKLKEYQIRTIEKLGMFLEKARLTDPQLAFIEEQDAKDYSSKYKQLPGMEDIPYICLRLPTGGGKTLLSSYAISVASDKYLEKEYQIVLWLVPTDIIRKQTLEVLKDQLHPNRAILDEQFSGQVRVYDIGDFTQLRPQDLQEATNIFVTTFAAFRVNSTDGRKVYAHNENLESHFGRISVADYFEKDEYGKVKYSFANLLAYTCPLVVIDEAHNHHSKLSTEVLQRLRPSAIIEFTATPAENSNVLFKVSASELKAEDMIKLPVRLAEHRSWEDAVTNAIQTRERLEELANQESSYIRPIVLFQAENIDREVTVEVILKYLVDQEEIPREQIAIATGSQRELDRINLFLPDCPIRFVITVQALKEGWDCSFAYVFCSLARVQSSKDAEQLLGRVLRMPYAKRRKHDDLNRAYAHVSVSTWAEAIDKIRDNLIGMGFEDVEAEANIQYTQPLFDDPQVLEEKQELIIYVQSEPNVAVLNLGLQADMTVEKSEEGNYKVTVVTTTKQDLHELIEKAPDVFNNIDDRNKLIQAVVTTKTYSRPLAPSEKGETIVVPQLCLDFGDGAGIADREAFLPSGWDLLSFSAILDNFQVNEENHIYEIDIQGTKLTERSVGSQETLNFRTATHWSQVQLVHWLDRKLRQSDIQYNALVEYIRRAVQHLQDHKRVSLPDLVRLRYILEKLLREKIAVNRKAAYEAGVQAILFDTPQVATVGPAATMVFRPGSYPVKSCYRGRVKFDKHLYPIIGDMNNEEEDCAKIIASHKKVKTWVRNIECQPQFSFWLPTSTDKFYPDFVAELTDGKILVVEYKGEHLVTNTDTREKDLLGQLWMKQSNGTCLFIMAVKKDEKGRSLSQQIDAIIN